MLGFLRYLIGQFIWHYQNKRGIYRLMKRGDRIVIRQGVTIINADRLKTPGPLRVETGCFLHCGGNSWSNYEGYIKFGKGCWMAQNNVLFGAGGIDFGDYSGAGPGAMIFSSRDNLSMEHAHKTGVIHRFAKVTIGSYVRIFSGCIIAPGVSIGDGAVVASNSIVLSNVEPWTVVAGSPARYIRDRRKDDRE